ncbi:hypothetical protein VW35_16030 [Devosia soli]|uniref:Abasic site processing protein n=1 Tax=Devosia soli TaxID=361041 RepID=A0A0F5L5S3_9HYPH|nr:SOS response-associated peptidase [Devosia soli]KKB76992.1 hypothetical protein VW35_16030 [Devosia soli]
MCNLYSHLSNREAILAFVQDVKRIHDTMGNFEPQPGIYPDYLGPIVRNTPDGRELAKARWGLPSSQKVIYDATVKRVEKLRAKKPDQPIDFDAMLKLEPDIGTTNVRNIKTAAGKWNQHWNRWMGVENRCVVPFTSFAEFDNTLGEDGKKRGNTWFALDESRPLMFFAGIHIPDWSGVRKQKLGFEEHISLYGFLTSEPNDVVGSIHMKAMPVILTTPAEVEMWLTAPKEEAISLQRPLPDGVLEIVAVGKSEDSDSR